MLTIVMVNANNYLGRGEEYVARLKAGVSRNLTIPHTFRVLNEDDSPPGVDGWWTKISIFQPGRFHGRCLFIDLDTVIVGSLDDIADYRGDFAMVRDWYHPQFKTSSLMAWDARKADHIHASWHNAGRPMFHPRGDGGFIEAVVPDAECLQDRYPGQLVSFKASCGQGVPEGARVVAFHGLPRPHHLNDIMRHW
jgi:hypothetical protein